MPSGSNLGEMHTRPQLARDVPVIARRIGQGFPPFRERGSMKTANFKTAGHHPTAIAISRGVPSWYRGKRYLGLAPTRKMLANLPDFDVEYDKLLAKLDPKKVYAELIQLCDGAEPILLCWEDFNVSCHRRRVAEWLMSQLDVEIPEFGHRLSESIPYSRTRANADRQRPTSRHRPSASTLIH